MYVFMLNICTQTYSIHMYMHAPAGISTRAHMHAHIGTQAHIQGVPKVHPQECEVEGCEGGTV